MSFFPVFGEWAEHAAIGRFSEPAVAGIADHLLLAIPDGLGFVHPPLALAVGGHQHEQVVKFGEGCAQSAIVIRFMPIRESLLRMPEESGSGFEVLRRHDGPPRRLPAHYFPGFQSSGGAFGSDAPPASWTDPQ